jgi:signal transduction histidine kinase
MAAGENESPSTLRRLRYLAMLGPLALLIVVELARWALAPLLSPWVTVLLVSAVALALLVVFYDQVFERLEAVERRLQRQNAELLALHSAALVVTADLSLDTVLQTVVDRARALLGTRYGAVSVIDEESRITAFLTSGISAETRAALGEPPRGHGILGEVLHEGQRLRLDDIESHPRSVGFPEHHPVMRTLLAVPIVCRVPHRGNLYVSEKEEGGSFTADDEEVLVRFASQAAIAIDNAWLYRQVRELGAARERLRIAHEMHDGLAQVLAYVNTKAQVVREYLRQGRTAEAQKHLDEFAEAARDIYGDVRQQILELRSAQPEEAGLARAITEYATGWSRQTGVELDLALESGVELPAEPGRQLLRIMQEALTNVRKHAGASRVRIELARGGSELRLSVADDGVGFDPETDRASGRFGLKTMEERAASIGATLAVAAGRGEGVRLELKVPLTAGA